MELQEFCLTKKKHFTQMYSIYNIYLYVGTYKMDSQSLDQFNIITKYITNLCICIQYTVAKEQISILNCIKAKGVLNPIYREKLCANCLMLNSP